MSAAGSAPIAAKVFAVVRIFTTCSRTAELRLGAALPFCWNSSASATGRGDGTAREVRVRHPFPAMPTFSLPCPTTTFTIGLLAFAVAPYLRSVLVVPILWAVVGTQAAFLLGVPQDLGLGVAGRVGVVLVARARRIPVT